MSSAHGFTAGILEASASGYAGIAATALLENDAALAERWAPDAFAAWKANLTQRILELAAALRLEQSAAFSRRVEWTRGALAAREMPVEDFAASIAALRAVLVEQVPAPADETVAAYLDEALAALAGAATPEECALEPSDPHGRLALTFLATILEGHPRRALDEIVAAHDDGHDVVDLYLEVLVPAEREIGRMWHQGTASVAEEHLVTNTTLRAMTLLSSRARRSQPKNRRALVAAVEGNAHEVATRAFADLLEIDGWEVLYLGGDVPTPDLVGAAIGFGVDLVALSGSLTTQVVQLSRALQALKQLEARPRVLVGGAIFDEAPDLWRRLQADAYSADLRSGLDRARQLVA